MLMKGALYPEKYYANGGDLFIHLLFIHSFTALFY